MGPMQNRAGCQGAAVAWGLEILLFCFCSVSSCFSLQWEAAPLCAASWGWGGMGGGAELLQLLQCEWLDFEAQLFTSPGLRPTPYKVSITTTHSSQYWEN